MSASNDGGPAFPQTETLMNSGFPDIKVREVTGGMTLRDWFAGMALQGALASPLDVAGDHYQEKRDEVCRVSYDYADAMLTTRNGKESA